MAMQNNITAVNVVGAGLAGCEAAWQLVKRGVPVKLYEMKPLKYSPAHHSEGFAELVCSNSLRSNMLSNAVGVLKEEMRLLDSLIIEAAYASEVPAGSALAVDRDLFSKYITEKLKNHPLVEVILGSPLQLGQIVAHVIFQLHATGLGLAVMQDSGRQVACGGALGQHVDVLAIFLGYHFPDFIPEVGGLHPEMLTQLAGAGNVDHDTGDLLLRVEGEHGVKEMVGTSLVMA